MILAGGALCRLSPSCTFKNSKRIQLTIIILHFLLGHIYQLVASQMGLNELNVRFNIFKRQIKTGLTAPIFPEDVGVGLRKINTDTAPTVKEFAECSSEGNDKMLRESNVITPRQFSISIFMRN